LRVRAVFLVAWCCGLACSQAAPPRPRAAAPAPRWTRRSQPGAIGQRCLRLAANGTMLALGPGIARSVDGGKTWSDVSAGMPRDEFTGTAELIVAAAATPTSLLAVGVSSRIYRSTDGGGSWSPGPRLENTTTSRVALLQEPGRIHLSREGSHFDSADDGLTWKQMPGRFWASVTPIRAGDGKLWMADQRGTVALSTDDGAHWQRPRGRGLPAAADFTAIAEDGGHLYLGTSMDGLYLSKDGGESWRPIAFAAAPPRRTPPKILGLVFAGTSLYVHAEDGIYRSERRGPWPLIHDWLRCPLLAVGADVYRTDHGVVTRSADRGDTWTTVGPSYGDDGVRKLATSPSGGIVVAFDFSGGPAFVSSDGGRTFSAAPPSRPAGAAAAGRTILLTGADAGPRSIDDGPGFLLRSDDAGATWTRLALPAGITVSRAYPLALDGDGVLLDAGGIFVSSDGARSWTHVPERLLLGFNDAAPATGFGTHGLFAGPNLVVSADEGLFVRARAGGPWQPIALAPPPRAGLPPLRQIRMLAAGGDDVYAGALGRLVRWDRGMTSDAAPAWTDLTDRVPAVSPPAQIELMAARGRRVLVATGGLHRAVFVSDDRGESWRPADEGLPAERITMLVANDEGWLAGTQGAGIWHHP
jgi:photosystem II stability/assembly factor-like uncharacterized protein